MAASESIGNGFATLASKDNVALDNKEQNSSLSEQTRQASMRFSSGVAKDVSSTAATTPCRNIFLYGYCKFESKGCAFRHDRTAPTRSAVSSNESPSKVDTQAKKGATLNVTSKVFQPGTSNPASQKKSFTVKAAAAPVFVPKSIETGPSSDIIPVASVSSPLEGDLVSTTQSLSLQNEIDRYETDVSPALYQDLNTYSHQDMGTVYDYSDHSPYYHNRETGYFSAPQSTFQPLSHHLYTPIAPHQLKLEPHQRTVSDFFLPENIRQEALRRAQATLQVIPDLNLPLTVGFYHSLVPLDTNAQRRSNIFGYPSWVYKAVDRRDGKTYALRRLEGYRLVDETAIAKVGKWKKLENASIVKLHEAFTTRAFDDNSIIFAYNFHPLAVTLADSVFSQKVIAGQLGNKVNVHDENQIWTYITQLFSAIQIAHSSGLSLRPIDVTKILTSKNLRVRVNACGVLDVIDPIKSQDTLVALQCNDLISTGKLLLALMQGTLNVKTDPMTVSKLKLNYSAHLVDFVNDLVNVESQTVNNLIQRMAPMVLRNYDAGLSDMIEQTLMGEIENGRLFRLLCKMGFINERLEHNGDPAWSDKGERYLIKLFRDYVFHQQTAKGKPVIDLAHVLTCLNKLDAGSDEKIMLVSRDEQTCLIVSYKEIKFGIETAFLDICHNS